MILATLHGPPQSQVLETRAQPIKTLLLAALVIGVASCSSIEIDPARTSFNTRITETRLKHFEVKINKEKTEIPTKLSDNPEVRRRQIQKLSPSRLNKQLQKAADFHITKSKFCKTGYWIIETNTYNPTMSLRAECNEPASDQDIENFPNTFKHW